MRGIIGNTGGKTTTDNSITIRNSYVAATSLDSNTYFGTSSQCSNVRGIYVGASTSGAKSIPPMPSSLPWWKIKTNHLFESPQTIDGITFVNFKDNVVSGCTGSSMFQSNEKAPDYQSIAIATNVVKENCGSSNYYNFPSAKDSDLGVDNCGGWHCTGLRNVLIKDRDGSITGNPTSFIANNQRVGSAVDGCSFSQKMNGYTCSGLEWGVLAFESIDPDKLVRIISPVNVTNEDGFRNDLNSYMDHVWDGFYTGLKRLSRFHSLIKTKDQYDITYKGTLPNNMRFQLQGAETDDWVMVW